MTFTFGSALSAAGIVLVVSVLANTAVAAEAYVCGPDKLVYVAVEDLERMKRTNACIAAYYGLKIEPQSPIVTTAKADQQVIGQAVNTSTAPLHLKPVVQDDTQRVRRAEMDSVAQLPRSPIPSPDTDYRNVRIINAASANQSWYRHQR